MTEAEYDALGEQSVKLVSEFLDKDKAHTDIVPILLLVDVSNGHIMLGSCFCPEHTANILLEFGAKAKANLNGWTETDLAS